MSHSDGTKLVTYYLEMNHSSHLRAAKAKSPPDIVECRKPIYQYNRFLYQYVGSNWQWTDKLAWSNKQWEAHVTRDELRTWVAYVDGVPAGYFELEKQADMNVEIAYFGLAEAFIGQGLGGYLLTRAIEHAWAWNGTTRVWVHTCNQDHPSALKNYQSRGLKIYRVEEH